MSSDDASLGSLLETVFQHLARGKADRHHPARHPTLATTGPNGPELRTLVLRGIDRDAPSLEFHTDGASAKVAQIRAAPQVALHVWIPKANLQIRASALATIQLGDQRLFETLPAEAQANYQGAVPGTPLSLNAPQTEPRFTKLICQITAFDILYLGTPHMRASYTGATNWQGTWITP